MTITPESAKLVIIGGGNMARAIVLGAIAADVVGASEMVVCEPDGHKRAAFEGVGVRAVDAHAEALGALRPGVGQILLAVKPQALASAGEQVRQALPSAARDCVVISILAGTSSEKVRAALGANMRVVRAMPNMAASMRRSATAICLGATARPGDDDFAERLCRGIGPLVVRIDESMMDAFTAVAASGPAYVFYLAEAMVNAAVEMGFDAATADQMVRETITGAAALLASSSDSPESLRGSVTSKGGTTEAAIGVFNAGGVATTVVRALQRARERGAELGRG